MPEFGLAGDDVFCVQTFLAVTRPLADGMLARLFPDQPVMVWDSDLIYQYFA